MEWQKGIPRKRADTMTDVDKVITFSCNDDADYITGSTTPIDGGWVQPLKDQ
ncbi:MAG: SDR family oxidoreductase [Lentisphaeria bacterium]